MSGEERGVRVARHARLSHFSFLFPHFSSCTGSAFPSDGRRLALQASPASPRRWDDPDSRQPSTFNVPAFNLQRPFTKSYANRSGSGTVGRLTFADLP